MAQRRLFHVTTADAARLIIGDGFRDAAGCYGTDVELEGVWFSDRPLEQHEGVKGETVLVVALATPLSSLDDYEVIEEGKPYREWCIPARIINKIGRTVRGSPLMLDL